jgi:hypothetical protein
MSGVFSDVEMSIGTASETIGVTSDPVRPGQGRLRWGGAILVGAVAATTVFSLVPASVFSARAIVEVTDIGSPLAVVLPRAAAEAAVSQPVLLRAAQALIETKTPIPAPGVFEQFAVAVGLNGAHATAQDARLAARLVASVGARPGDVPGSVEVAARAPDAARAAMIASTLAEALVAEQDDAIVQAGRKRDIDFISVIERLNAQAAAARRRLAALGGSDADPTQMRAAAAGQTATIQARLDTIRAIIASGTPPLSDRRDVPSGIETLQTSYLDLSRQLAKARETLGDRHTTIISLQSEVKHAAATLTAEWRRLAHLAETELAAARQREAALRAADPAADASRRGAIEEARRAVRIAEDAIAQAQASQTQMPPDMRPYRLMARAPVPGVAEGFSSVTRGIAAGLLGLLAFWLRLKLSAAAGARRFVARVSGHALREPVPDRRDPQPEHHAFVDSAANARPVIRADAAGLARVPLTRKREVDMPSLDGPVPVVEPDETLITSLSALLPGLESISPSFGPIPTVIVAANELAVSSMPVALALGHAAVAAGYRVLVVEAARARPELATAADPDADPLLVDLYGVLRVALPAAGSDGFFYLAPSFEQGARIASALARQMETPLVEDVASEFDLIVIDGGRAVDCVAAGWGADAYIRVGRFAAERDDDQFAATFHVPASALLGTIVSSSLAPKLRRAPAAAHMAPIAPSVHPAPVRQRHPIPTPGAVPRDVRRVGARRVAGARGGAGRY